MDELPHIIQVYMNLFPKRITLYIQTEYDLLNFGIESEFQKFDDNIRVKYLLHGFRRIHYCIQNIKSKDDFKMLENKVEYAVRHILCLENKVFWERKNININHNFKDEILFTYKCLILFPKKTVYASQKNQKQNKDRRRKKAVVDSFLKENHGHWRWLLQ